MSYGQFGAGQYNKCFQSEPEDYIAMEPPPQRPSSNHHHHYHISPSAHPTAYHLNHSSQPLHQSSQSLHHSAPNIHENHSVQHESPIHPPVSTICPRHGNNSLRNGSSEKKMLGVEPPAASKPTQPKERDTKEIMKKRRERAICIVSMAFNRQNITFNLINFVYK